MKIAVMTFWESQNNYGQLLQLFALQTYLKEQGHDAFLVRYYRIPKYSNKTIVKQNIKKGISVFIGFFKKEKVKSADYQLRGFDTFKNKYITFSEHSYRSIDELRKNPPIADAYVCGSDQIWNNELLVSCEAFLLGFGKRETIRFSYAASFGQRELTPDTEKMFKKYIDNFDGISVREKSGLDICAKLNYANATWVPDPTLLFSKEEWCKELDIKLTRNQDQKSIFVYTLGNSKLNEKDLFLNFIKQMPDYDVLQVSANNDFSGNVCPTIEEWIQYIAESSFVITSSFHGMVFCIIFNKNFVVLPNTGKASGMNERITSLLHKVGLYEHMMVDFNENELKKLMTKEIDWTSINDTIKEWKKEADTFLEEMLSIKA